MNIDWEKKAIDDVTSELVKAEALKVLLGNNDFACIVTVCGLEMGICDNSWLIPVIDNHIAEVVKFLNGEPNSYE